MKHYNHHDTVYSIITGVPLVSMSDYTLKKIVDLRNGYHISMRDKAKAELVKRTLLGKRDRNGKSAGSFTGPIWFDESSSFNP